MFYKNLLMTKPVFRKAGNQSPPSPRQAGTLPHFLQALVEGNLNAKICRRFTSVYFTVQAYTIHYTIVNNKQIIICHSLAPLTEKR